MGFPVLLLKRQMLVLLYLTKQCIVHIQNQKPLSFSGRVQLLHLVVFYSAGYFSQVLLSIETQTNIYFSGTPRYISSHPLKHFILLLYIHRHIKIT